MCDRQHNKCLICGKLIPYKDLVYCDEHRIYAEYDNKIIEDAPLEVLFSLIAGIFVRAKIDYIFNTDKQKQDAEQFFRSEWAQELSLTQFDPDDVLKQMDEEIEDGITVLRSDTFKNKWQ